MLARQSIIVLLAIAFAFVVKTLLTSLTVPILGGLIASYIILSHQKKETLEIFILSSLILILISSTGSLSSPLFFLLYFLSFGIVFIFESKTVFVLTLLLTIFFSPELLQNDRMDNLTRLSSLFLIAPLAFFFGNEFKRRSKLAQDSKDAADTIARDIGKVLQAEKQTLKEKDVEKLNEILEKTEKLREETNDK